MKKNLSESGCCVRMENGLICRRKLTTMLNSFNERVIYICAPAGYGKTVAIRQWLDRDDCISAVLSLDEYDNAVEHFCKGLCKALLECQPHNNAISKIVSHPAFENAPDEFTVRVLAELSGSEKARIAIDDLHFVHNERVLRLLVNFLRRLPEIFQIVLISREELPTVFAELWLKGNLARVTANDLRFSSDDITQLYEKHGCHIMQEQADIVYRLTDGWAIAISALLLSDGNLSNSSIEHLDAFILDNVWKRLDDSTRNFMLKTSVVGELTPSICDALTGESNSEALLEQLVQHNVFISRNKRGIYQFHRLFREFLNKLPEFQKIKLFLLERAGYWYLQQKDFYNALEYFVLCENKKGIVKCFLFLSVIDRDSFIVDKILPYLHVPVVKDTTAKFPFIYCLIAWCAFAEGRHLDMAYYADRYYEKQFTVLRYDLRLAFYIIFMRLVDFRVTLKSLIHLVRKIPKLFVSDKTSGLKPSIGIINQYMPLLHRGTRDFSECAIPDVKTNIAELLSAIGKLFCDEADLLANCAIAGLLYEQGNLQEAYKYAFSANSEIKKHFATETKFCAMSILVYVLGALGEQEQATAHMELIADMIEQDRAYVLSYNFRALKTRMALEKGEINFAHEWLAEHALGLHDDMDFFKLYGHLTTCRSYIAIGEYDSAVILLKKVLMIAEAYNRPLDVVEARILLSIAYWKKKRNFQNDAIRHLEQAVSVAYQYGYSQAFISEGTELAGMLLRLKKRAEQHAEDMPPASYVKLLYLKALEHQTSIIVCESAENLPKFTEKQKEVMKLLCDGKSYREMSAAMDITRPTLRVHIAAIYNKLGVTTGTDAIKKINSLGLIESE